MSCKGSNVFKGILSRQSSLFLFPPSLSLPSLLSPLPSRPGEGLWGQGGGPLTNGSLSGKKKTSCRDIFKTTHTRSAGVRRALSMFRCRSFQ